MGFRQYIEEKKQKQSYKSLVYKSTLFFVLLLLTILGTYIYWQYRRECEKNAAKEAQSMAERVVSQVEERLTNLEQYYVAVSEHQALQLCSLLTQSSGSKTQFYHAVCYRFQHHRTYL